MLDNRVFIFGFNMGRVEEVPSWQPYEDDRPIDEPVVDTSQKIELPFKL